MEPAILAVLTLGGWELDGQDLLLFAGGASLGVAYAAGFAFCVLELTLRPVRVELGATIDRGEAKRLGYFSLKSKVLLGLVITAVVMGFAAGVLIAQPDSSFLEGLRIVVIAVVTAILVGGSLALPFSKAALTPIDDLVAGTREVAAGNLDARVPVTSTDEFGDLVVSFNEMVEGLREREALRDHNAELVESLRASQARIVAASNEARRKVERDLHDGAQQNLVLLNLKLGLVERAVADDPATLALVEETRAELEQALAELRDLAHGIYPQVLTSDGLPAALAEAIDAAPIATTLDSDGAGRYSAGARGRGLLLLPRGAAERGQARGRGCANQRQALGIRRRAPLRGRRRRLRVRRRLRERQRRPPEHGRPDRGARRRAAGRLGAGSGHDRERLGAAGRLTWTPGWSGCTSASAGGT